jgi:hypothetical protein
MAALRGIIRFPQAQRPPVNGDSRMSGMTAGIAHLCYASTEFSRRTVTSVHEGFRSVLGAKVTPTRRCSPVIASGGRAVSAVDGRSRRNRIRFTQR